MLKIELIRFEVEDIITASVATPNEDTKADPVCACVENGCRLSNANVLPGTPRDHYLGATGYTKCGGVEGTGVHTCGKQ